MIVIYKIASILKPNRFYIGSAVNYDNRVKRHIYELKRQNHKNKILQNHFNKYENDLQFSIIEILENKSDLIAKEQFYIDLLKPTFNICKIAGSSLGVKRSDEFKLKISIAKTGKKHRQICNVEKSIRQTGKQRKKGYKHSEAAKLKISKNNAKKRPVIQKDLEGNFLKEWESILLASKELNVCQVAISICCRGLTKTSARFKWEYKNK